MAESIKDKVAIIGMGCTKFGERWDVGFADLIIEAAYEACQDAGITPQDIDASWVASSTRMGLGGIGSSVPGTGLTVAMPLKLDYKPVTRVENACGGGIDCIRNAAFGVASGTYDIVLAIGIEKLKDQGFGGSGAEGGLPPHPVYEGQMRAPGMYALAATRYFRRYGIPPEEGKRMLAEISVKSHYNGSRNPKAFFQKEVSIETVINAPIISWPLGLFDCCGVADGAAAAILCRAEDAKKFRDDYVLIKGLGLAIGPGQGGIRNDYDYTHWEETRRASLQAYTQAGITNPREELDLVELHDCFSIAELIATESLGLCPTGEAKKDILSGAWRQDGVIPINLSGGLKSFGHPVGASGCRETYEVYKQLQGKAQNPSRQLKNPRLGLVHNQGGIPGKFMAAVAIFGLPD